MVVSKLKYDCSFHVILIQQRSIHFLLMCEFFFHYVSNLSLVAIGVYEVCRAWSVDSEVEVEKDLQNSFLTKRNVLKFKNCLDTVDQTQTK